MPWEKKPAAALSVLPSEKSRNSRLFPAAKPVLIAARSTQRSILMRNAADGVQPADSMKMDGSLNVTRLPNCSLPGIANELRGMSPIPTAH